jgi:nucleotide-binding universal stress UspA family protein
MKILLAIDGSAYSDAAVWEVSRRLWAPDTEVRLITVDPPVDAGLLRGGSPTAFDELVKQQRVEAVRRLNEAMTVFKQNAPNLLVTPVLREGWPKDVILDEAERWGADLIVVGSHGKGAIRRFFLGSVSLAVATNAPCSVEIVRSPPPSSSDAATTPS